MEDESLDDDNHSSNNIDNDSSSESQINVVIIVSNSGNSDLLSNIGCTCKFNHPSHVCTSNRSMPIGWLILILLFAVGLGVLQQGMSKKAESESIEDDDVDTAGDDNTETEATVGNGVTNILGIIPNNYGSNDGIPLEHMEFIGHRFNITSNDMIITDYEVVDMDDEVVDMDDEVVDMDDESLDDDNHSSDTQNDWLASMWESF